MQDKTLLTRLGHKIIQSKHLRQTVTLILGVIILTCAVVNVRKLYNVASDEVLIKRTDFPSYYMGGLLSTKENYSGIYSLTKQKEVYPSLSGISIAKYHKITNYKYIDQEPDVYLLPFRAPPMTAIIYGGLVAFSVQNAYYIILLFGIIAVLYSSFVVSRDFLRQKQKNTTKNLLMTTVFSVTISFASLATIHALGHGQPTTIILFALILSYEVLKEGKTFIAGLLAGLVALKPQFIVLLPFTTLSLKIENQKIYLLGIVTSLITQLLISVSFFGTKIFANYIYLVKETQNKYYFNSLEYMYSVQGFFAKSLGISNLDLSIIILSVVAFIICIILFIKACSKLKFQTKYFLGIAIGTIFSMNVLLHDLILVIPIINLLILKLISYEKN